MMKQGRILQELLICLEEKWQIQLENLKRKMSCEEIVCREYAAVFNSERVLTERMKYSVLLTDCSKKAVEWKRRGGVCIGCICSENFDGFFDGADLVTESLDDLDIDIIEETLLHGLGLPVTIAETQRLIIREITRDDVDKLYQISQQPGMEYLMRDQNGENCFEPERMLSYIENVYRFYGYGLWSVWTKAGELIGCCGLSEFERRTDSECSLCCRTDSECLLYYEAADTHGGAAAENSENQSRNSEGQTQMELHTGLELQYMLAPEYQRQGYGMEMCTAALNYAFDRTDWEEVRIRIHPDNQESIRLAQRLGFLPEEHGPEEMRLFVLRREEHVEPCDGKGMC